MFNATPVKILDNSSCYGFAHRVMSSYATSSAGASSRGPSSHIASSARASSIVTATSAATSDCLASFLDLVLPFFRGDNKVSFFSINHPSKAPVSSAGHRPPNLISSDEAFA